MTYRIFSVNIHYENDTVAARQCARQIAKLLGCDAHDQTRVATAVSEIARNAFWYGGGGKIEYEGEVDARPQMLTIRISDEGPGIADLNRILEGRFRSTTGMGLGIIGARRLMDDFEIASQARSGTVVLLKKVLPHKAGPITPEKLAEVANLLALEKPHD